MRRIGVAIIEVQRDAGTSGRPAPNGSLPEAAMGDNWFKWLNRSRLSPEDPFLQH
jgi:hypothetical protein